jgi:3-methyladenine DNA glycosylase Mpg
MTPWTLLLQRPVPFDDVVAPDWFARIADQLLNGAQLVVADKAHRFTEIEFYYHGPDHLDPFAHCDPVQLNCGRWYFHRTNGVYRSGSFKGLDLAFGAGSAYAGVLIRGVETAEGTRIDGPSLFVDHLLGETKAAGVAVLDQMIAGRLAWEEGNPVWLRTAADLEPRPVLRTARVGLSLKRGKGKPDMPRFLLRRYRYLTEPRRISKGKPHMVLALHADGRTPAQIQQLTGCPRASVQRYIAGFETGRQQSDFAPFIGSDLSPSDLCRLHGIWHAAWGEVPSL